MKSWALRLIRSRGVYWGTGAASFCETLFVPIPLEVILIPVMVARRDRLWKIAAVVTGACLVGAVIGYFIGYLLFASAGQWMLDTLGYHEQFRSFRDFFQREGFWAILAVGVTPVPFQVAMLAAGLTHYPLPLFLLASAMARGVRYFGLALLVRLFGRKAEEIWRRNKLRVSFAALCLVALLYLLLARLGESS